MRFAIYIIHSAHQYNTYQVSQCWIITDWKLPKKCRKCLFYWHIHRYRIDSWSNFVNVFFLFLFLPNSSFSKRIIAPSQDLHGRSYLWQNLYRNCHGLSLDSVAVQQNHFESEWINSSIFTSTVIALLECEDLKWARKHTTHMMSMSMILWFDFIEKYTYWLWPTGQHISKIILTLLRKTVVQRLDKPKWQDEWRHFF